MAASTKSAISSRNAKKCADLCKILIKEDVRAQTKKVIAALKKPESQRTEEDKIVLESSPDAVRAIEKRAKTRKLAKERTEETEDLPEVVEQKCSELSKLIHNAKCLLVFTGAGISTAAAIPDYRGPNGVWTLLQQGKQVSCKDLSEAEPTFTHMSLSKLHKENLVKYVVSQNCDGLHVRSGLPRESLSELHGNMFIEQCPSCDESKDYIRLFDVTEKTGFRKHKTGRKCHCCRTELRDTIVHFGEKGSMGSPYNWEEAAAWVDLADVILCLGSSLKVLKKYPCLWSMHKPVIKRPKICIVNLQWTPKDDAAVLKINAKCDIVMKHLMSNLNLDVPCYVSEKDPIFKLATLLKGTEHNSTSKKILQLPEGVEIKVQDVKPASKNKRKGSRKPTPRKFKMKEKIKKMKAIIAQGFLSQSFESKEEECGSDDIKVDIKEDTTENSLPQGKDKLSAIDSQLPSDLSELSHQPQKIKSEPMLTNNITHSLQSFQHQQLFARPECGQGHYLVAQASQSNGMLLSTAYQDHNYLGRNAVGQFMPLVHYGDHDYTPNPFFDISQAHLHPPAPISYNPFTSQYYAVPQPAPISSHTMIHPCNTTNIPSTEGSSDTSRDLQDDVSAMREYYGRQRASEEKEGFPFPTIVEALKKPAMAPPMNVLTTNNVENSSPMSPIIIPDDVEAQTETAQQEEITLSHLHRSESDNDSNDSASTLPYEDSHTESSSSTPSTPVTDHIKVAPLSFTGFHNTSSALNGNDEKEADHVEMLVTGNCIEESENVDEESKVAPSAPGWFGKGLAMKKRKKRLKSKC